jgi:hypothetical protein
VDPVLIDGKRLRVGPRAGEDDALEILLEQTGVRTPPMRVDFADDQAVRRARKTPTTAAASAPEAAPAAAPALDPTASAVGALRGFPTMPAWVERQCTKRAGGETVEFSCDRGLEARLAYETDAARSFLTLALVGVPGLRDEAACRAWLKAAVPGLPTPRRVDEGPQVNGYASRAGADYLYTWMKDGGRGSGACSILACRPDGHGHGEDCKAR